MSAEGKQILNKVVEKGGLFAIGAKMYINDPRLTDQFIVELSEHYHAPGAKMLWGDELNEQIMKYAKELDDKKKQATTG
jgi:hypothetical protein